MNYKVIYQQLITKRQQQPLTKKNDGTIESHHIIPKSEGGSNELSNLVNLTAREHFIAHLLLAKIYNDCKMWCALVRMMGTHKMIKNSRLYAEAKRNRSMKFSEYMKLHWTTHPHPNKGKALSEEHKSHLRGKRNGMYGRHHTPETIAKMSAKHKGKIISKETCQKISESNKDKFVSKETRQKISKSKKGRPSPLKAKHLTLDHIMKIRDSNPQKKVIQQLSLHGEVVKEFSSISDAAHELKVTRPAISKCLRGLMPTCAGYKWKYKNG